MQVGKAIYEGPHDLPDSIPVFPLAGALLLPRGQLPLTIFEPRYLAMVDDAMAGNRLIGMIQPMRPRDESAEPALSPIGCVGRITSYSETEEGRVMIGLTGIARFRILAEGEGRSGYRICRVSSGEFRDDFAENAGADAVDRTRLLDVLRAYLAANQLEADWDHIGRASNETLVNALSMMSPYGPAEKQALLEASSLRARAETLIALTEMTLARGGDGVTSTRLQ